MDILRIFIARSIFSINRGNGIKPTIRNENASSSSRRPLSRRSCGSNSFNYCTRLYISINKTRNSVDAEHKDSLNKMYSKHGLIDSSKELEKDFAIPHWKWINRKLELTLCLVDSVPSSKSPSKLALKINLEKTFPMSHKVMKIEIVYPNYKV